MPAMTFDTILTKAANPTGCGVLVVRRDGKVLTGTRIENASRGQICGPGGHIEPGETPRRAAKREAMEEFGIICNKLIPLGTQGTKGGYGRSALFLCTDYIGKPMTDEEEMTDPRWRTIEEIKEQNVYPPFLNSLKLLPERRIAKTFEQILKYNHNHDAAGRFASSPGGGGTQGHKEAQLSVIQRSNPMMDDYHTGIRDTSDILTAHEAFGDEDSFGGTPDWSFEDAQDAIRTGKVTVYSSKEISDGAFVTPSKMTAQDYAGGGGINSMEVSVDDVAWIDDTEGQYAPVKKGEDMSEFRIYKTDEDQRLVFGWASVSITVNGEVLEDRQHDMIEPEDLEEAAYEYVLNFRETGEEHLPGYRKKGRLVESCVFTPEKQKAMGIPPGTLPVAWWIGFKIDDEDTWQRVKNGTYRMFSIEGRAQREEIEKADRTARYFDEVLKYNHNHDALGRFSSGPGGGGRSYGATNTSDARAEVSSGKHNSLEKHMDANGNLTPEREKVHKEIIDKLLEGKVGVEGQATMTMLGGGPASGKSSVMSADTSGDIHAVTVDPDTIKKMLPGFDEMAKTDPSAAAFYHEESSALAKRFAEVAFSENLNVIYDGTGDGGFSSVQRKIDSAKAHGYKLEAKYVTIDTEEAVRRNQKRYDDAVARGETPRLPPVDVVRKTHAKVTDVAVKMAPQFDHIEVWDNNGERGHQKKIAEGGSGQHLKATSGNQASLSRFLSKSVSGVDGFITLPNGQVVPVDEAKG